MAVFIEKLPVTSSNSYETMKNASILMKLGTNVDWTIAFVTACSSLNFISKLPKLLFCIVFFSIKIDFKVLLLNGLRWRKGLFRVGYMLP
jgi:hypothetical protein